MDAPAADPATIPNTLLIGIPGRFSICGQTSFRQDTASYTAENDKFKYDVCTADNGQFASGVNK